MALSVGWNASGDGSIILHAIEADGQSQVVCMPHHLQNAFEDYARLIKRATDLPKAEAKIYSQLVELLSKLRGLQEAANR